MPGRGSAQAQHLVVSKHQWHLRTRTLKLKERGFPCRRGHGGTTPLCTAPVYIILRVLCDWGSTGVAKKA